MQDKMETPEMPSRSPDYAGKTLFFEERAGHWLNSSFSAEEISRLESLLVPFDLREGQTVLEPGCGGGRLTSWLVEQVGETGQVVACDLSERLVQGAKDRVRAKNVRWTCGPVETLDLREESVDRIICFQSFPHFERKSTLLKRFLRWTQPEGKLLIFHLISRERVNEIHQTAGGAVANDLLPTGDEMEALLASTGWEPVLISDGAVYVALASKPVSA